MAIRSTYSKGADILIDVAINPPVDVPTLNLQDSVISFAAINGATGRTIASCDTATTANTGEASLIKTTNTSSLQEARLTIPGALTATAYNNTGKDTLPVLWEFTIIASDGGRYRGSTWSGKFSLVR